MNEELILALVKQRLGITSNARDIYLQHIIKSVIDNLTKIRGILLDPDRHDHIFFIVKYAVWEYESKGNNNADKSAKGTANLGMPAWLRLSLNNMIMKSGG